MPCWNIPIISMQWPRKVVLSFLLIYKRKRCDWCKYDKQPSASLTSRTFFTHIKNISRSFSLYLTRDTLLVKLSSSWLTYTHYSQEMAKTSTSASVSFASNIEVTAAVPRYPEDSDTIDLGCFATEDEELDIELVTEEPWKYDKTSSRVFYPIQIGEVLDHGRYRIEHKLGHGGFSTVWMAYDFQKKQDVALKIMASGESGEHEYRIQKEIPQDIQDTSHIITYLATFFLRGDGCNHRVLVFPLLGQCLFDIHVRKKSMATRLSAARQLLETLENLHKAGIMHRGK